MLSESERVASPSLNAALEEEVDRFGPRANLIEAVVMFAVLEFSIWGLIGGGVSVASEALEQAMGHGFLVMGVVGMVWISPILHGDCAAAWGLPSGFGRLRPRLGAFGKGWTRVLWVASISLVVAQGWPNLLARLGVRKHLPWVFEFLTGSAGGYLLGVGVASVVMLQLVGACMRWDNLATAARVFVPLTIAGVVGVWWGASWLEPSLEDPRTGRVFDALWPHPDRAGVAFYWLWAMVQQALFLAYFNVRLRRGVGPGGFAGGASRSLVALLCGVIFAALHAPNAPLMAGTFVLGVVWGWLFQADRRRHLGLAALSHATIASVYAARMPFSMDVGPWQ
ncbi:CPBP family intramembrane metalloprotease [Myxococcota bacterium]|nr:CPBP family intramembrane metalloprotease [Myxococcota bacterium]